MPAAYVRTERLFQKLDKLTRGMSSRATPDAVHDLRTTVRRIETLINVFGRNEQRNIGKLAKQLKHLRRRAGEVRNVDVQLAALQSLRLDTGQRDRAILHRHLSEVRDKRERKLLRVVEDEIANGLQERVQYGMKVLGAPIPGGPPQDFSAEALRNFQTVAEGYSTFTEQNLHALRIACKRIRYLAELSGETPEGRSVVAALKQVQDAIGEWHDWFTLNEVAEEVIANPASPLLAALHAYRRSRLNEAVLVSSQVRELLLSKRAALDQSSPAASTKAGVQAESGPQRLPFRKEAASIGTPSKKLAASLAG